MMVLFWAEYSSFPRKDNVLALRKSEHIDLFLSQSLKKIFLMKINLINIENNIFFLKNKYQLDLEK